MSDIVSQLRLVAGKIADVDDHLTVHLAADEIERLREALRSYLFAEQIDDEMERRAELSVARQEAEALLAGSERK